MQRPYTTLFLLSSLDGKISTGIGDYMDFDIDLPTVCPDLSPYYTAELKTDVWSMISGNIVAKLITARGKFTTTHHNCKHVLVDSQRLTHEMIEQVGDSCDGLILLTDDRYGYRSDFSSKVWDVHFQSMGNLNSIMDYLVRQGINTLTVQTGGTFNSSMLRAGLIDRVDIFVAPVIVGGKDTHSMADGISLVNSCELMQLSRLTNVKVFQAGSGMVRYVADVENTVGHRVVPSGYPIENNVSDKLSMCVGG